MEKVFEVRTQLIRELYIEPVNKDGTEVCFNVHIQIY